MREYGVVFTSFWNHKKMRPLSEDGRVAALYLLTSPHSNSIGSYLLPDGYAVDDLQWTRERVSEALGELSQKGFAKRFADGRHIAVCDFIEWNEPENPNVLKAMVKQFNQLPDDLTGIYSLAGILQHEAWLAPKERTRLKTLYEHLGKEFEKRFGEPFRNPNLTEPEPNHTQNRTKPEPNRTLSRARAENAEPTGSRPDGLALEGQPPIAPVSEPDGEKKPAELTATLEGLRGKLRSDIWAKHLSDAVMVDADTIGLTTRWSKSEIEINAEEVIAKHFGRPITFVVVERRAPASTPAAVPKRTAEPEPDLASMEPGWEENFTVWRAIRAEMRPIDWNTWFVGARLNGAMHSIVVKTSFAKHKILELFGELLERRLGQPVEVHIEGKAKVAS